MNAHQPFGNLQPFFDRIKSLPPFQWFEDKHVDECRAIIGGSDATQGRSSGMDLMLVCEVLGRSIAGLEWSRRQMAALTPGAKPALRLGQVLDIARLDAISLRNVVLQIAAERAELDGEELLWWLPYEDAFLEEFRRRGADILLTPEAVITALVEQGDYNILCGLIQVGVPHERIRPFVRPEMWLRLLFSATQGWRHDDWKKA